ncbi:MAG TPA: type II toxin-antitoxin system ParD family antitoxin [Edaphobacter sp.]|nr:type II toxin-antitoxin system ParD family antitoxin [Edaphobacter sp.]
MAMTSLNISLPQQLKSYVEFQVADGEYGTPSEYVRELIRRDKQAQLARLEKSLLKALDSGSIRITTKELAGRPLLELLEEKLSERPRKRQKK